MKGLIYLLITVVALGLAAGITACKPSVPEEPVEREAPGIGETAKEPDYECEACGENWTVAEFEEYCAHMGGHGLNYICDVEVTKPSGAEGPCGAAFATEDELRDHMAEVHGAAGGE